MIMEIKKYNEKFPLIVIDDFYNQESLESIWEELNFLCYPSKLENPETSRGAVDDNGGELKNIGSIFLSQIYSNFTKSNIFLESLETQKVLVEVFKDHDSWFFQNFYHKGVNTLVSYYENGGYYKAHQDASIATVLNWFYKEPKRFEGGDLHFPDYDMTIKVKNNRLIVFPSCIRHEVFKVEMEEQDCNKKLGRFCVTHFL